MGSSPPHQRILEALTKSQLNSELIYDVMLSKNANQKFYGFMPYQTNKDHTQTNWLHSPKKNHPKKRYNPCLFGRAEILTIFGLHFGRSDELKN